MVVRKLTAQLQNECVHDKVNGANKDQVPFCQWSPVACMKNEGDTNESVKSGLCSTGNVEPPSFLADVEPRGKMERKVDQEEDTENMPKQGKNRSNRINRGGRDSPQNGARWEKKKGSML